MRLTREDDIRVREALAARIARGEPVPQPRPLEETRRGFGANPAYIYVSDRYSAARR